MILEGAIVSDLLSKLISDGVDISKTAIQNFVEGRYKPYQNLYSQIYKILVQVLHTITYHCYEKDPERIYEAAEILLREYRDHPAGGDGMSCVQACLCSLHSRADEDNCRYFKELLYEEFSKDTYQELYRALRLHQQEQKERADRAALSELGKKVEEVKELVSGSGKDEGEGTSRAEEKSPFMRDKKKDYLERWDQSMFLHQNQGKRRLTLAEAFVMPACRIRTAAEGTNIRQGDTLEQMIRKFANSPGTSAMLITGAPGMGKSSLVSWIAHTYQRDDRFILLRFRDWESEELAQGLLKAFCRTLACGKEDLSGRILVLDGFDELKALHIRKKVLNRFLSEQQDISGLKVIITSRPNYIQTAAFENVFTLQPFDITKMELFHMRVTGKGLERRPDSENRDIFGIPVILYMAIMSKIDISQKTTKPQIYGRIFAEKGGIFDRFSYGGIAYSEGAHVLRNAGNIRRYLEFLQNVAFEMFEKGSPILYLEEEDIPELEFEGESVKILEFPIRYLFENSESCIEFIHKSIYEYFAAEYLAAGIREGGARGKAEQLAGKLAELAGGSRISDEMVEYLSYRLATDDETGRGMTPPFTISGRLTGSELLKEAFFVMLKQGMCRYCAQENSGGIDQELTIFQNMLQICKAIAYKERPLALKHKQEFVTYLAHARIRESQLTITGLDLSGFVFDDLCLKGVSFEQINLRDATFEQTDLSGAKFVGSDLSGAVFREVVLNKTEFSEVNLAAALFQKSEIRSAKFTECTIKTVFRNCNLQESRFSHSVINHLDFSNSNIKYVKFIKDQISRGFPIVFYNAVLDQNLLLEVEKRFGGCVKNCKVDLCDNVLPYEEYCRFRVQKQGELQKEIMAFLAAGQERGEWES